MSNSNYIYENSFDFPNNQIDQSIIIQRKYLPNVEPTFKHLNDDDNLNPLNDIDWYPLTNSYYPFTEDVDAFARVHHLLEPNQHHYEHYCSSSINIPKTSSSKNYISYEKQAQLDYLQSKPLSFLVLGKPDIGQDQVAQHLADYWNCVLIEPRALLLDEINGNTRTGHCIEFNLRCGRAIGAEIILRLIAKKVHDCERVKHCGFVLCGMPLIRNELYTDEPVSSESAIFNVEDIFEELVDAIVMDRDDESVIQRQVSMSSKARTLVVNNEENEDLVVDDEALKPFSQQELVSLSISSTRKNFDHQDSYKDQVDFIFDLLEKSPFMIVYAICELADAIQIRRDNYWFDIYSQQQLRRDLAQEYLVQLPANFPANVSTQLAQYHQSVLNLIEHHILTLPDLDYYLKLDGRLSPAKQFDLIKARLSILPVQPVVLAKRFQDDYYDELGGENEENQTVPDPSNLVELFAKFSTKHCSGRQFPWTWSDWGGKCPVSMQQGHINLLGNADYAVHFMNKLFFLYNDEACEQFIMNPRPFLLPPNPQSNCRIFVFGPSKSGRSTVAKCLSYLLDGTVLNPQQIHANYLQMRFQEYQEQIRQIAQIEAMKLLDEQRLLKMEELKNQTRLDAVAEWINNCKLILQQLIKAELLSIKEELCQQLHDNYHLPLITTATTEEAQKYLDNVDLLISCVPANLGNVEIVPPVPATIFDDFVRDYVIQAETTITIDDIHIDDEDIYEMYRNSIKEVEDESMKRNNRKGGWIVDGMSTDRGLLERLQPEYQADEIILLHDTSDDFEFLMNLFNLNFSGINQADDIEFRDFKEYFRKIGRFDASLRTPSLLSTSTYKNRFAQELIEVTIDNLFDESRLTDEQVNDYRRQLEDFSESWNLIKDLFPSDTMIEVSVNGKRNLEMLLEVVIDRIDDRYRQTASILTDEERAEEIQIFRSTLLTDIDNIDEGDNNDKDMVEQNLFDINRRYGSTFYYCPVTYHDRCVLWRGKEEFAVKFEHKVYLLSNDKDMIRFAENPRKFLIKQFTPPPLRICVIGLKGSGKTTVSKQLAHNLGVRYISYEERLFETTAENNNNQSIKEFVEKLWFKHPWKTYGFVLDDYPQESDDLDYMIEAKTIPDCVIYLSASQEIIGERWLEQNLMTWRTDLTAKQQQYDLDKAETIDAWKIEREQRFNQLIEEQRSKRFLEHKTDSRSQEEQNDGDLMKSTSQISFRSIDEQDDIVIVTEILTNELPEPQFEEIIWESEEEARERFDGNVTEKYLNGLSSVEKIIDLCDKHLIPLKKLNSNSFDDKVIVQAYIATNPIKFRGNCLFEQCYNVSVEIAEQLLFDGYYFLSKFGKFCPVQYYHDNNNKLIHPDGSNNNLFPTIHRSYIYFVAGWKNSIKFKTNPLKYLMNNVRISLRPLRIAVIGPPKCGKTSLSERYRNDFGFKLITRGQAARYVLDELAESQLALDMLEVLRKGLVLTNRMTMKSVEALTFDCDAVRYGVVFDGFPNTPSEVKYLSRLGLLPHFAIDLAPSDRGYSSKSFSNGRSIWIDNYSPRFCAMLYNNWARNAQEFRLWYQQEFQHCELIPTESSLWSIWCESKDLSLKAFAQIKHYYLNAYHCHYQTNGLITMALSLANMQITPLEFATRQCLRYRSYCALCLIYTNKLRNAGRPMKRFGLVQFRQFFYWVCAEHLAEFLTKSLDDDFIILSDNSCLPDDLPEYLMLDSAKTDANLCYENGLCVVCFLKNLPKKLLIIGNLIYAAGYKTRIYLFDSSNCLDDFMSTPNVYCDVVINFKNTGDNYPLLNYRDLPNLGQLEQYVSDSLIKSLNNTNINRPIIPGLNISQSALINIGLNLKLLNNNNNNNTKNKQRTIFSMPLYEHAYCLFNNKRNDLINYLIRMKRTMNPYLYYSTNQFDANYYSINAITLTTSQSMLNLIDEILNSIHYKNRSQSVYDFIQDRLLLMGHGDYCEEQENV